MGLVDQVPHSKGEKEKNLKSLKKLQGPVGDQGTAPQSTTSSLSTLLPHFPQAYLTLALICLVEKIAFTQIDFTCQGAKH